MHGRESFSRTQLSFTCSRNILPFIQHNSKSLSLTSILLQMKAYYIYIRSMFNIPPICKRMYQVTPYIQDSQIKFLILVSSFSCVIYALSECCSYSKALPPHFHINARLTNTGLSDVSNFLFSCMNLMLFKFVE